MKTLLLLAAQTFIQMSDPQFGLYTENRSFAQETANFEFAVAAANRLKPAFVIVTGDLLNQATNPAQLAEYRRIAHKLDPKIPMYNLPGNHDMENEPTPQSLALYRKHFGPDYYSFRAGDMAGIVLNSILEKAPKDVSAEAAKMETWFRSELEKMKQAGAKQIIVFQHYPFFLTDPDEEESYFNIPKETRRRYLTLMHEFGVKQVFAGHLHRNSEGHDGDLEMITTGPVGKPFDGGKSGFRVVTVTPDGVTHHYYDFSDLP